MLQFYFCMLHGQVHTWAQCAQMLKFGNKFNSLTASNHMRLVECLLEAEFKYLHNEKKIIILRDSGTQFLNLDIPFKINLFASNSAQISNLRLIKSSLELELSCLYNEKHFQNILIFEVLVFNFAKWAFCTSTHLTFACECLQFCQMYKLHVQLHLNYGDVIYHIPVLCCVSSNWCLKRYFLW